MTKEITAILILTAIAVTSLVGWFFFEQNSVIKRIDFSEKAAAPLNPTLNTQILQ